MDELQKIDILELVNAQNWSQEEKQNLIDEFYVGLSANLVTKLEKKLPPESRDEYKQLTSKNYVQPDEVQLFFQQYIPDFAETVQKESLLYKRDFLLFLYSSYIESYKGELKNGSSNELRKWKQIYELAQNNQWEEILKILN